VAVETVAACYCMTMTRGGRGRDGKRSGITCRTVPAARTHTPLALVTATDSVLTDNHDDPDHSRACVLTALKSIQTNSTHVPSGAYS